MSHMGYYSDEDFDQKELIFERLVAPYDGNALPKVGYVKVGKDLFVALV